MSWPLVCLESITEKVDYGLTASAKTDLSGPRFLRITDLQEGSVNWETVPSCEYSQRDIEQYGLRAGDIVFARTGATTGKSYLLDKLDSDVVFASYLIRVRPNTKVDPQYLSYFFKSPKYWQQISVMANGAAQPGVNSTKLKQLQIPLPPIKEQKRIAAILDKADAIRRKRQQAIKLADDFLRSVFLDMFGDIPAKKSNFELKGCRDYVTASSGKSSKTVLSEVATDIPIYGGNGVNGYATKALYSEPVIVVGRVGQQCAITNLTEGPCWVTDNAIIVQVVDKSKFNAVYLAHAFMHSPIRDAVTQLDLPFVNQQMILDHPIPHAPIELQKKFVLIRDGLLRNLSSQFASLDKVTANFNALSQKAFSGKL